MDLNIFIAHFHNIEGSTLAEKQKNFNSLLTNLPSDHDALLPNLTPNTQFEHLLKLRLLLKLQRIPDLLQILKSEQEYLPAKLLKNKLFCQQLAKLLDENSTGFVDGVLPFTSYVIRGRIITKLATYGTKLDTIYQEVRNRYGTHIASALLVACSASKIEQVLKSETIALTPLCQKLLYQKHPRLFALYAKNRDVEDCVMNYVAICNMGDFIELSTSSNFGASLGKHLTRKLLNTAKDLVIANSDKFSRMIHLKTTIKTLVEEDMKRFFFHCCPTTIKDWLYGGCVGYTNLKEKLGSRFYPLLFETIDAKFKKSLYDFPDKIDEKTMQTMEVEERLKWVEIKKNNGTSEDKDDLIAFMRVEDAIALIKSKINVTSSIPGRDQLVQLLVKACHVNNDLNALAEVGEYMCFRHRNDSERILNNFLYQIQALFQLEKLGERHWKFINTLSSIVGTDCWYTHDLLLKNIEFLFRENKLSDDKIREFFEKVRRPYQTDIKALHKRLLLKSIELRPALLNKDEKIEYTDLVLLKDVFKWNKENKNNQIAISEHPRLIQSLQKSMKDAIEIDSYVPELLVLKSILESIICAKQSDFRVEAIESYFAMGYHFFNLSIDMWLLKHQPSTIDTHFVKFLNHLFHGFSPNLSLLNYIKKFTSPSFQTKIINHALTTITENSDAVFHVLVILEPTDSFLQHIAPFYPSGNKIQDDNEEERRKGNIAIAIAQSFKYATSTKVLPSLILYCKGDFLRYSLESLYYLFYHSPENQLSVFIDDLSSKAVSVRKHSIFLTCIVGSVNDVKKLLTKFIENERNVSVQKHLFTAALKYFIKSPSDDFWECVKVCMSKLDENDNESFKMLVNLHQIPQKYQARHVIFVWDILKKSEENRPRLLLSIPSSLFKDFPLAFFLEVITDNFLKTESSCVNVIDDFVATSLTYSVHTDEILAAIFERIKKVQVTACALNEEVSNRKKLSSFVTSLVSCDNYEVLSVFLQRWHDTFSVTQAMREHLQLSFALFYLQSGKDLMKFATTVADFLDDLVTTYGIVIVDCFASVLNDSLQSFLRCYTEPNEDFYKFVLHLVKNWDNLVFYLLAIRLLPQKQPQDDRKALFDEVVQVLRQVPQESIQMLMNIYVMDLEF